MSRIVRAKSPREKKTSERLRKKALARVLFLSGKVRTGNEVAQEAGNFPKPSKERPRASVLATAAVAPDRPLIRQLVTRVRIAKRGSAVALVFSAAAPPPRIYVTPMRASVRENEALIYTTGCLSLRFPFSANHDMAIRVCNLF